MNDNIFDRLLYEEESATLDFKQVQYRFAKASEEDKSELLKDIIGFANAWRRSEAYILIGVEDMRGGRGKVVGIPATDHLDDHALQQFVNNLTNHPVLFHYEAFGFEGKQIGIIRIEEQTRPLYLKKDYGKLKKEQVYVRRGSSTDTSKPGSIDEIARMGQGSRAQSAELNVEFAHILRDDALGNRICHNTILCTMPAMHLIPIYKPSIQIKNGLGIDVSSLLDNSFSRSNPSYLRELAAYEFARRLFRPIRLVVQNLGQVVANSVRVELMVPFSLGVTVWDRADFPTLPKRRSDFDFTSTSEMVRRVARRSVGEVDIDKDGERFRLEIECGDLQPGRRVWSQVFYTCKRSSGEVSINGQIFADNLPEPKDICLVISFEVESTVMSLNELERLPEPVEPGHSEGSQ